MERVLADIDADDGDFATVFLGHGVLRCLRCPSPAWTTGRAGARPDHPINGVANCRAPAGPNTFRPTISLHDPSPVLLDLPVHRIGREVQVIRPGDCA